MSNNEHSNGTTEKIKVGEALRAETKLLFHCRNDIREKRPLYLIDRIDKHGIVLQEPMATWDVLLNKIKADGALGLIFMPVEKFGPGETQKQKEHFETYPQDLSYSAHPE